MKKLSVLLALLLFALPATAATYPSFSTTTGQESVVTWARTTWNTAGCASRGLPASCTQAEADAVTAPEGQPALPAVTIYATNQVFVRDMLVNLFQGWRAQQVAEMKAALEKAEAAATQTQKDARCVAAGLLAGCLP